MERHTGRVVDCPHSSARAVAAAIAALAVDYPGARIEGLAGPRNTVAAARRRRLDVPHHTGTCQGCYQGTFVDM